MGAFAKDLAFRAASVFLGRASLGLLKDEAKVMGILKPYLRRYIARRRLAFSIRFLVTYSVKVMPISWRKVALK